MTAVAMLLDLLRVDDQRVQGKRLSALTSFAIDLVHICRCVEWSFPDESTPGLVTLVEELRNDLR